MSIIHVLGLLLNAGFNADPKRPWNGFYLKRSFATLTPSIFLPLYKTFILPHLEYAIQPSSPILSRDRQALESVQKLAVRFVKGAAPRPIGDSPPAAAAIIPVLLL